MARHVAAILNPASGRRNMLFHVQRIQQAVERGGGRLDILVTERRGHATQLASGLDADVDAVLIVGGDGTLGEVVNGLGDRRVPMLILRTGTENLFAREMEMPIDPAPIAAALLDGEVFSADAGVINGRRFVVVAGIGFDAECVERMNRIRRGHITHLDYFWPVWQTFWAHRYPEISVDTDGERVFEGRGFAIIGGIPRYSLGLRVVARARIDDGLLDICIFPCGSRIKMARHTLRIFRGKHIGRGGVVYRQCREIRIDSPQRVPIEIDGEPGGVLPMACEVLPNAVQFIRFRSRGERRQP